MSHLPTWQISADYWQKTLVPQHIGLSIGLFEYPYGITVGFAIASEPAKLKQYFMTYHGKVTLILTTCNCLHKAALFTDREDYMRTRKPGGRDH